MRNIIKTMMIAAVMLTALPSLSADAPVTEKEILSYLDESILLYRDVTAAETSDINSREALLHKSLKQNALRALRYAFDFARVQNDILTEIQTEEDRAAIEADKVEAAQDTEENAEEDEDPGTDDTDKPFNAAQAKINIDLRAADLRRRIAATDSELGRASQAQRAVLQARRKKLDAELNLAKTQSDLIEAVLKMSSSEDTTETLAGQIDNLAKAIPELAQTKKKSDASNATASNTTTITTTTSPSVTQALIPGLPNTDTKALPEATSEAKGVIGLVSELIKRSRQKQDLSNLLDETRTVQKTNADKISEQRDRLLEIVNRSRELSKITDNAPAEALVEQGRELTQLNVDFKRLSALIVPLSKQRLALAGAVQNVEAWQEIFSDEMSEVARRLVIRIVTLLIVIAVPFLLSEIARRGLSQYVADARRRRQFNIMRRVIVGILVALIVILNLISEFGSIATFIGFLTAGLAVALQNVILSIVAYFFFFGRFGIKIGSRVTIGTTTGDVIETGFIRLYIMEVIEEKGQFRPTGRIVAFPNSILFQPTPFFKQVPGVSYRWHEMTYMLEPDTERALAEMKLRELIDSVYKDSKGMIDMQKAAMEQSTRLRVKEPRPEGKVEKTADGLNIVIRYPVDTEAAETTDKSVMRQADEIFERLPSVSRISNDPPVIKRK